MISEGLKRNSTLTELNVNGQEEYLKNERNKNIINRNVGKQQRKQAGNKIGSDGAKVISKLLKRNTTLIELDVGSE